MQKFAQKLRHLLTHHTRSCESLPLVTCLSSSYTRCWISGCLARLYRHQEIPLAVVSWPVHSITKQLCHHICTKTTSILHTTQWAYTFWSGRYQKQLRPQQLLPWWPRLLICSPSKRKVSTSCLISSSVRPLPSSSRASSRMSRKSRYLFLLSSGFSSWMPQKSELTWWAGV